MVGWCLYSSGLAFVSVTGVPFLPPSLCVCLGLVVCPSVCLPLLLSLAVCPSVFLSTFSSLDGCLILFSLFSFASLTIFVP